MTLSEIETLSHQKMREHGVGLWQFRFDKAKRRLGSCNYRTKTISLSSNISKHPDDEIINTLLHEIAHALAGPKAAHGPRWREVAQSIGCNGRRVSELTMVEAPMRTIACDTCTYTYSIRRFRLPGWLTRHRRCGECRVGKTRETPWTP